MERPIKDPDFALAPAALRELSALRDTLDSRADRATVLSRYVHSAELTHHTIDANTYLGTVARNVLTIIPHDLRQGTGMQKFMLEESTKRLSKRAPGYKEIKQHIEQDASLDTTGKETLLSALAGVEMSLSDIDAFCKRELTHIRNRPIEEKMADADAQWVAKLGLEKGARPVSMVEGMRLIQRADGGWSVGG